MNGKDEVIRTRPKLGERLEQTIHPSLLTTFGTVSPAILYSCGFSGQQMTMPSAPEFEQVGPPNLERPAEVRFSPSLQAKGFFASALC